MPRESSRGDFIAIGLHWQSVYVDLLGKIMTLTHGLLLVCYALGMAMGQLIFKAASIDILRSAGGMSMMAVLTNGWFLIAASLYAGLSVLWVWILTKVPLAYAYPFVVLSFIFTPVGAALIYGEQLTINYAIGMVLILAGLAFLVIKGA